MLNFKQFSVNLSEDTSNFTTPPHVGSPADPGVSVHGIHYSHKAGLDSLQGKHFGTGIKGAEHARVAESEDQRIKSRVYVYNKSPGRLPPPETGLGPHVHSVVVHGIFDPGKASDADRAIIREHRQKYMGAKFANPQNAFESALVDSGFRGYTNGHATVILNHDHVPVKYEGHKLDVKG